MQEEINNALDYRFSYFHQERWRLRDRIKNILYSSDAWFLNHPEKPGSNISESFLSETLNDQINRVLVEFEDKINTIKHPHIVAKRLLLDLKQAQYDFIENFKMLNNSSQQQELKRAFKNRCTDLITKAKAILEKDLGWSDYLTNLLKAFANAIIRIVSFGRKNHFFKPKVSESSDAVNEVKINLVLQL